MQSRLGPGPTFPPSCPLQKRLDLALDLAAKIHLRCRSLWNPPFSMRGWDLACNFPTCPLGRKIWACSGTCLPKATSDSRANGNQHFPEGSWTLARNLPNSPLGKNFGHVLEPVCPKPPQIMEPMEPTFSRRVLDPGLQFPKLDPWVKTLAMFWDLCVQSHLR